VLDNPSPVLPTILQPGSASAKVQVDYNVFQRSVTGVGLVFYGLDRQGNWHVLPGGGADPDTMKLTNPKTLVGNSEQRGSVTLDSGEVTLATVDPSNPATDLVTVTFLLVPIGSPDDTVPPDPAHTNFGLSGP